MWHTRPSSHGVCICSTTQQGCFNPQYSAYVQAFHCWPHREKIIINFSSRHKHTVKLYTSKVTLREFSSSKVWHVCITQECTSHIHECHTHTHTHGTWHTVAYYQLPTLTTTMEGFHIDAREGLSSANCIYKVQTKPKLHHLQARKAQRPGLAVKPVDIRSKKRGKVTLGRPNRTQHLLHL